MLQPSPLSSSISIRQKAVKGHFSQSVLKKMLPFHPFRRLGQFNGSIGIRWKGSRWKGSRSSSSSSSSRHRHDKLSLLSSLAFPSLALNGGAGVLDVMLFETGRCDRNDSLNGSFKARVSFFSFFFSCVDRFPIGSVAVQGSPESNPWNSRKTDPPDRGSPRKGKKKQ